MPLHQQKFVFACVSYQHQTFYIAETYSYLLLMPLRAEHLTKNFNVALFWCETEGIISQNMADMLGQAKKEGFIDSFEFMTAVKNIEALP